MAVSDQLKTIISNFPATFDQAQSDWAKFKLANSRGLLTRNQVNEIVDWFYEFPKLWNGIRPHFEEGTTERPATAAEKAFAEKVNRWIVRLRGEAEFTNRIGIAPLIIAGIAIAGAFGITGIFWGVGYLQRQRNISRMIDGVTAGTLPPEVLTKAIEEEKSGNFLTDIKDLLIVGGLVILAVLILPRILGAKGGAD